MRPYGKSRRITALYLVRARKRTEILPDADPQGTHCRLCRGASRLGQRQERYKQEKLRTYENYRDGVLTKDAYLKQRAEIDSRIATAKAEQEKQEQLLSELERLAFQDKMQKDDVFITYAGAEELTAELAGTFIKEILVSSPTEIEIVWKFRNVFDMQGNDN